MPQKGTIEILVKNRAGAEEARLLESRLLFDYRPTFDMPRAQSLLLALRQVLPTVADSVLQRSGDLYTASAVA